MPGAPPSRRLARRRLAAALLPFIGIALPYLAGWIFSHPVPARIGPAPRDLNAGNVTFQSASGSMIHGWLCEAPQPRGSVLLLPGVRANRLSMVNRARFLRDAGYSVLLIDLQATGESGG